MEHIGPDRFDHCHNRLRIRVDAQRTDGRRIPDRVGDLSGKRSRYLTRQTAPRRCYADSFDTQRRNRSRLTHILQRVYLNRRTGHVTKVPVASTQ